MPEQETVPCPNTGSRAVRVAPKPGGRVGTRVLRASLKGTNVNSVMRAIARAPSGGKVGRGTGCPRAGPLVGAVRNSFPVSRVIS